MFIFIRFVAFSGVYERINSNWQWIKILIIMVTREKATNFESSIPCDLSEISQ